MNGNICEGCGTEIAGHEGGVNLGSIEKGYRHLCTSCYNSTIAEYAGVKFEHPNFEPIVLVDVDGHPHEFHFVTRLLGDRVALDAYEVQAGERRGYEFEALGFEPEGEVLLLFKTLLEKMRRLLGRKHVERTAYGWRLVEPHVARGRIDSDPDSDDRMPLLWIDGRPFTWEELGRMLMSYEGWQFRLEIKDQSDSI